ncbi:DUF1232 domain-containing protein [Jiella endophytica]|uniref:DUF1232 domain-containing protein n=1 Tax=Jiella endophytica TaxID=2558362 RepID=A0A4Y8RUS2_9HYPH|nr:DUF1232 domain-containing protein [Jiella endophytica]TFF27502.1 DUF1232 domain-containing protein [Jiella endophytica]
MTAGPHGDRASRGKRDRLRHWAKALRRDAAALWLAARDPRTPILAKLVAGAVASYALSPIDLIPDFIPILGLLDDLLIVPLGILLAIRLIPPALWTEFRAAAQARLERPAGRWAAIAIVGIWIGAAAATVMLAWSSLSGR